MRRIYAPVIEALRRRARARGPSEAEVVIWQSTRTRLSLGPAYPRVVVLKLDHLGDFVTALPALTQLRTGFPHAEMIFVCGSWNRPWAEASALFDRILTFDYFGPAAGRGSKAVHWQRDFDALPIGPCDLAVDLRHDPDTRPLLQRIDAGFRAGFSAPVEMGGDRLDIALPDLEHVSTVTGTGRPVHAQMRLELLVAAVLSAWSKQPHPAQMLVRNDRGCLHQGRYAVLAPGAGCEIRIWSWERLAEVGRLLSERHDLDIVLTGGPNDRETCDLIAAKLPPGRVRNMAGVLPIADLPTMIRYACLYVGYDTGATHLAAALAIPTVAVMGGISDPDVWHAEGSLVAEVTTRIACSGCYLKQATQCPFDVKCLTSILPRHVLDAAERVMIQTAESEVATVPAD